MQFSEDSTRFLKHLIPKFKTFYTNDDSLNGIDKLASIYADIVLGDKYYENIKNNIDIKFVEKSEIVESESINSSHYSQRVKEYIKTKGKSQFVFKFNILNRVIAVYFTLFNDEDISSIKIYNKYIRLIVIWLFMCNKYSTSTCSNTLNIFFYLTPFPKVLPKNKNMIISYENINTGMTYRCVPNNEIFIYRQEEWFKVFIHETFHSYGLDIDVHDSKALGSIVKKMFPIKSTFNIAEAYTETWARILNCCFVSYESSGEKSIGEFNLYLQFAIQAEKMFSLIQLKKILAHMDLTYENLWSSTQISEYMRANLYREESNVFSYFVLAGIFMNDFETFIQWCDTNNTSFIKYTKSHTNLKKFGKLIDSMYKSKHLINNIHNTKLPNNKNKNYELLNNTGRMTCIEIKI
tara:strand:- start:944 stop:2164 length:1221 start_codon:yes stop_codon:yes gene_type:complete